MSWRRTARRWRRTRRGFREVLTQSSWLESKVSEGGTALVRVREQLELALGGARWLAGGAQRPPAPPAGFYERPVVEVARDSDRLHGLPPLRPILDRWG